jgi:hypothetical protein
LSHTRKAEARAGDNTGRTRFVKYEHQTAPKEPKHGQKLLFPVQEKRTVYPTSVRHASTVPNVLVSGKNNVKIGRTVEKGPWKGKMLYYVTLEERKTCPAYCLNYMTCYGNNMPFASRVVHDKTFENRLQNQVAVFSARHRNGIVVRLHILGDFYSREYVYLWGIMLARHRSLCVFGYTAWRPDSEIGKAVRRVSRMFPDRWKVRFSNARKSKKLAIERSYTWQYGKPRPEGVICPAQTGKTPTCGTCGLCWTMARPVVFMEH